MSTKDFLTEYKKQVAGYLRVKEAHMARGQLERLVALEKISDEQLLIKWAFLSAIVGSVLSFVVIPILLGLIRYFLPHMFITFLWALTKVMMIMTIAMFGIAFYLLFQKPANNK